MNRTLIRIWSATAFLLVGAAIGGQAVLEDMVKESRSLRAQGKFKEAVFILRQAVEALPEDADAHYRLAESLGELSGNQANAGDFTSAMASVNEAFSELDRATTLDPDHFDAHLYYGVYALNVPAFFGKLEPGLLHLETARALVQRNPQSHPAAQQAVLNRFLGQAYQAAGRTEEARNAWEKTLSLEPEGENAAAAKKGLDGLKTKAAAGPEKTAPAETGDAASLKAGGKAAVASGKWTEAVDFLRQAVRRDTTDLESVLLLARALAEEAGFGYDERIYADQNWRTNLAFEMARELETANRRFPGNPDIQMMYAMTCVQMPFFVGKIDEGLAILEKMSKNPNLADSIRTEAAFQLGFGYRKKGRSVWAGLVKDNPDAASARGIYGEFGLREHHAKSASGERVDVTFHLGFQDELEPQTAVWVEDASGRHVRTLYVSGFSGYAKEKQVDLPEFAERTKFEDTDGVTGASIDWGTHTYSWDLKDRGGKRVPSGLYTIRIEASWWPSMRYESSRTAVRVGGKPEESAAPKEPLIPFFRARYVKK
jgi:tetratricopeptide (TPR) repeat protein